jgi:hypothetical protein
MALPTASDNKFPKVIYKEQDPVTPADVATPAANHWATFMGDDGELYVKDDAGTITQLSGGAATLADGDYGDITVSSSGTVLSIDADTITTTELANNAVETANITDGHVTVAKLSTGAKTGQITVVIDGGGAEITTGIKGDLEIPIGVTLTAVRMLADQSGSIVVDIWKDTYANFPPTDADSITAAAPPTISTATKSEDTSLTGWTTSVTAGDILRFNVDSVTTIERVTISIRFTKA